MKIIVIFCFAICIFFGACTNANLKKGQITVNWAEHLPGDYSFRYDWSYPEGVYKNSQGQLSCDGSCPPEIDAMKDNAGKIIRDSLRSFYRYVDTTHMQHSILSEAWCYEWAGTDYIEARKKNADTVQLATAANVATHCVLHLNIVNNICTPKIELISIMPNGSATYLCKGGWIKLDRSLWGKDTVKAEFSFTFDHKKDPKQPMFWKGKIFTKIKTP